MLRFKGEMGYVKHDVSKAIKTVMNSASGGFREQAADLKRVSRFKVVKLGTYPVERPSRAKGEHAMPVFTRAGHSDARWCFVCVHPRKTNLWQQR